MAHDPNTLEEILTQAAPPDPELEFLPMFGGIMGYAGDKVFASLSSGGLALKLSGAEHEALLARLGAEPLQYDPDQAPGTSYVVVPEAMLGDPDQLRSWVVRCTASLGPKRKHTRP